MIVVDTNVVAYLLLPGQQTAAARAVLARDAAWAAPLLWRSEFRNVLALYLRQRHLSLAQAIELQATGEALLAGREYAVDSGDVLTLAAQSGRSAYDCEFVAVARALGVPLITSDGQLAGSFPELAVDVQAFASGATGA
ncbi:MAG: type II toxin-antitoxin system VapC family toxin [Gemmatimonadaceae bacterium]